MDSIVGSDFSKLRAEKEVMSTWKGDETKPLVSILCHTYNHVGYIRDALNGFLLQETDFPFEIILHDDASTDGTTEIIKEYSDVYPNIIVTIIQAENKYSQGVRALNITLPVASGKYIAFCEGDDFWNNKDKLRIQVNKMEELHVDFSFHPSATLRDDVLADSNMKYAEKIYTSKDLILEDFHFVQTNTIVFNKDVVANFDKEIWRVAPVYDFFIRIIASEKNGAYCIPTTMGVYRVQSIGSWTSSQNDPGNHAEFIRKMINACDVYNKLSDGIYKDEFLSYKSRLAMSLVYKIKNDLSMKKDFMKEFYKYLKLSDKLRYYIVTSFLYSSFSALIKKIYK
ncbi:glycosyltransferase family 2 protein [Amphritea pacifica]|uniref:glycosyltransferase family 2 protein n=1 Tax=Amphritea pacifica TaxID=2811233 RepID=UPI001965EB2A|nr:glycosyltransferase [Amphritea pacifica]MBN1005317.1 glycosyltransferase [Amphritea pacifica]